MAVMIIVGGWSDWMSWFSSSQLLCNVTRGLVTAGVTNSPGAGQQGI